MNEEQDVDIITFIHDNYTFLSKYRLNHVIKDTFILYYNYYYGFTLYDTADNNRRTEIKLDNVHCRNTVVYPYINDNIGVGNIDLYYINTCIKNIKNLSKTLLVMINDNHIEYYFNNNVINSYKGKPTIENDIKYVIRGLISQDELQKCNESIYNLGNQKTENNFVLQNGILNENIKLYNYQIEDVKWMYNIRDEIINKTNKIEYIENREYIYGNLLYDILTDELLTIEEVDVEKTTIVKKYNYRGGNLVSEMGLGKSIIALYYILSTLHDRQLYNNFVEFLINDKCNYLYKKGKNAGNFCTKKKIKESVYCGEHRGTLFVDKPVTLYKNKDLFNLDDFLIGEKIKSNASLIICPNHLCDQWVNEYYSKFVNDKRVIMIITQNQFSNITFGDLLLSDIIIISYQFLLKLPKEFNTTTIGEIRNKGGDVLESTEFNYLKLFKWRGVFLDECHEISKLQKSNAIISFIYDLKSETVWNITGTPCANGVTGYINLLTFNTYNCKYNINNNYINSTKRLFRKNNKKTIDELPENIIKENLKIVEFTQQERNIYESCNNKNNVNFLIKLCCDIELNKDIHDLIKNSKTMDEIQLIMLRDSEKKKDKLSNEINMLVIEKDNIEFLLREMINERDELIQDLRNNLTNIKRNITTKTNDYNSINRTYTYLNNVINSLKEDEQECPICLDTIENMTITKCGHKFCWDCLYETHNVKGNRILKCPTCNTQLNKNEIYCMEEKVVEKDDKNKELNEIIEVCKSSKLGNIIYFIKQLEITKDKIIIFSQWDVILDKIQRLLTEYKLEHVYCTGTVYNKKRMIKQFTKGDMNIILLSSKNSASGINLTEANKIILVEPVYGTREYRDNIESQAIGRVDRIGQDKPIDIYRFIVKDTIEEQIYNGYEDYNINI